MPSEIRDAVQPREFPPGFSIWPARQDVSKNGFLSLKRKHSKEKSKLNEKNRAIQDKSPPLDQHRPESRCVDKSSKSSLNWIQKA